MSRINKADELLVARYLDGELDSSARERFEDRVDREAVLRGSLERLRDDRRLLRSAAGSADLPPAGFADGVLDLVHAMPPRRELIRMVADETALSEVARHARRLLVAAVLLFTLSTLFGLGLLGDMDPDQLSASDLEQKMEELDAKAKARREAELRIR